MRRALGAEVVPDVEAPPNYSIVLAASRNEGRVRELHRLFQSTRLVLRTRDPVRLLHGLANYLSAFLPPPEGLLRTAAMAVVADGEAVLVPGSLLSAVKLVQPRLHRAGFQIADVPVTLLAPDTAELVVPEPGVTVDEAVIEGVGGGSPMSEPRRVTPGRYPVRAWLMNVGADEEGPVTRATAVAGAFSWVHVDGTDEIAGVLERLGDLLVRVPAIAIPPLRPTDVVGRLRGALAEVAREGR